MPETSRQPAPVALPAPSAPATALPASTLALPAPNDAAASRGLVITAYAALYIIWGSTYLAIRYAVETLPPFMMAGARFVLAGAILALWARWRDGARATR